MRIVKSAVRAALTRAGYWTTHRSVLPFGIDYLFDIERLAAKYEIPIKCAFDIGAHGGDTATEFLNAFLGAQVHSFEPHPDSFAHLTKVKSDRLHPHKLAASNKCGPADFFVYSESFDGAGGLASANNSLVPDTQFGLVQGRNTKSIKVQCITVDQFCLKHSIQSVDILKIDTEGHEVAVLDGARNTLLSGLVRFVFLEFETMLPIANATGGALTPAAERLEPLGFRLVATYPVNMLYSPFYTSFNALFFLPTPPPTTPSR